MPTMFLKKHDLLDCQRMRRIPNVQYYIAIMLFVTHGSPQTLRIAMESQQCSIESSLECQFLNPAGSHKKAAGMLKFELEFVYW